MGAIMVSNSLAHISLEKIAASVPAETVMWMQIYFFPKKDIVIDIVKRAEKAGYTALVVTVDEPDDYEVRCNARGRFVKRGRRLLGFPNLKSKFDSVRADPSTTFDDITWLSKITSLPIVAKGIMTGEDAKQAIEAGASAIFVSNQGGRELDGSLPTIDVLPEIVEAVNSAYPWIEVYMDGGIRSGYDIFKAIALGARAVFIGRPALWGLTMGGGDGVKRVLSILRQEFTETMIHAGKLE
ncbi:hydroxyacid oxidase 1 [Nephila pilipes]|uniref:Hydroxyacid oxidase 1 n=1 Tax=Nephila pilipes TaxID=299642 RepID=A0A8X6PHZ3_NEPPI|nr:hydroxyacid oxidase 1 [Nephila pilipes]